MPSSYIEQAIYAYLITQSTVTAYVGTDIYHAARPQGLETPYITYDMIIPSNDPMSFAGGTDMAQPTFQFSIFAKNPTTIMEIGDALITLLNRFDSTLDGMQVYYTEARGPMVTRDTSDEEWYMGVVEFMVGYNR